MFPVSACRPRSTAVQASDPFNGPNRYSGCIFAMVPAWRYNAKAENTATKGVTAIASSGDTIGQFVSHAADASHVGSPVDGVRPTWTTGNGRNATITFNGSSTLMSITNSKRLFKTLHATGTGEIWVWLNPQASPTSGYILNSNRGSTANTGLYLYSYGSAAGANAGKVEFGMSKGTAIVTAIKSTDTISAGTGKWVKVSFAPGTATGTIAIGGGSDTTFNVGTPGGGDATDDLAIGRLANNSTDYLKAHVGPILIYNRQLTSLERTAILAWDPTVSDSCSLPWTDGDLTNTYSWQLNRFQDAYLYTDTGRTSLASADGNSIKVAAHVWGGGSVDISRDMTSTGATDPKRQSPSGASAKGVQWGAGGAVNTDRLTRGLALPRFSKATTFCIVRNTRTGGGVTGQGSQFVNFSSGSANYKFVGDTSFDENPANTGRHIVVHFGDGSSYESTTNGTTDGATLDSSHFNVIAEVQDGNSYKLYVNGVQVATTTNSSFCAWDEVGGEGSSSRDFYLWGYELELAYTPIAATAAQVLSHYNKAVSLFGLT